ncbi:MAG: hypothetical protein P8184_14370, partial [Calditrichia bacterium]
YIRQYHFETEQQRRLQYALDDWISYLQSNRISDIAIGYNYIYFATLDGGILRYHLYQHFWDYPYTTSNGLPTNQILKVAFDKDNGYLWAITQFGPCIFDPARQEWICKRQTNYWPYQFPTQTAPDSGTQIQYDVFYPAEYLNLLPTFFANGGYTITGEWILMDENFQEFPITGFFRDHWERIWFVIEGLGVGIGDYYSQRMDVVPYGLSSISPRVLKYQNDDLWIGGLEEHGRGIHGIVNWRNSDGGWYYYQARYNPYLPNDDVNDIAVTGDSVWFATDIGVSLFDTRKNRWKHYGVKDGMYGDQILDLLVNRNMLYIGTMEGINTINLDSGVVKRVKDETVKLATVYRMAGQSDTLWAATNRGIFRQTPDSMKWKPVSSTASIEEIPATAVTTFGNEVWFTSPGGVFWLDTKTGKWESFPQIGLDLQGPFYDIAVNDKSVWVSTPEGLLKYDRQQLYWRLYTTEDGLLNNECFRLLLDGDYIWVANRFGITQFYWNNPDRMD